MTYARFLKGFMIGVCISALTVGCSVSGGGDDGPTGGASTQVLYVSTAGNDANSGTETNSPLRTLAAAVGKINTADASILVGTGDYRPGEGLQSSDNGLMISNISGLTLLGGYNGDFSVQTGYSVLDGTNGLFHVVSMSNVSNITMNGFHVIRGRADGGGDSNNGGGIYARYSMLVRITNCVFFSNHAVGWGGAIYVGYSQNFSINSEINRNTANSGAGIILIESSDNHINSAINTNIALSWGGGVYISGGNTNTIGGTLSSNVGFEGGGTCVYGGSGHVLNGMIRHNCAFYGAGVFIYYGTGYVISGAVLGNTASSMSGGGGIHVVQGNSHTFGGTVSSNSAPEGGGFYLQNTADAHTFTATVKFNSQYGVSTNSGSAPDLGSITWGTGGEANSPGNVGP